MKILWANAAGRCAFQGCQLKLCTEGAGGILHHAIGEMAHICGERPNSNRYDASQLEEVRNGYGNLILLCPTHHALVDKAENEERYDVAVLLKMKAEYELWVSNELESEQPDKAAVARSVFPLLKQNRQVFLAFGPKSEIARTNPSSDAHAVWLTERLSTLVPNNRRMAEIVEKHAKLFDDAEKEVLSKFTLHVRSYERWVTEDVSYEGVVRFPPEFEEMIAEMCGVSP